MSAWFRRHPSAGFALLGLVVAALVSSGDPSVTDTVCRLQVTHWLWRGEPQTVASSDCAAPPIPGRDGRLFAPYGVGQSVAMLPADVVAHVVLGAVNPRPELAGKLHLALVVLLTFPLISGLGLASSHRLVQELGYSRAVADLACLGLLFGTTFLPFAQIHQENSLTYLCLSASLFCLLRGARCGSAGLAAAAGALLGATLLIKISNIALVVPAIALAWYAISVVEAGRRGAGGAARAPASRRSAMLAAYAVPIVAALAIDRAYHWYRFESLTTTYGDLLVAAFAVAGGAPAGFPFGFDRLRGFTGPLIAPERSIFLFDPLLVLLIPFLAVAWTSIERLTRATIACLAAAFLCLALAFSGTYYWDGASSWGPRHHLVPVELMILVGLAPLIARLPRMRAAWRWAAVALVAVSIVVQVSALPKSYNIEGHQIELGEKNRFVPALRLHNLLSLARGSFASDNRHHGNASLLHAATSPSASTLLPFRIGPYVGARIQRAIVAGWLVAVAAVLSVVSAVARNDWRRVRLEACAIPGADPARPSAGGS